MRKLIVIFLLLFASNIALAQDPEVELKFYLKNENTGKSLAGVIITVYKDGAVFQTRTSDSKGRTKSVFIPVGSVYKIEFKKDGFVGKFANMDARYDTPEDLNPFIERKMEFSLFEKVEGVDFSFLDREPLVNFEFTSDGYEMGWDVPYSEQMLKKIAKIKKEAEKKIKEQAEKQAKFDEFMAAGNKALTKKKYEDAVKQFTSALGIFNDDATAKAKQAEAQKKLDELNNAAQKDKDYSAKTAEARKALEAGELENAKSLYQDAKKIKPAETLPDTEIAKIDKLIAEQKANQAKFDKFVADGDAAISNKSYENAITKYTEALKIQPKNADVIEKLANAKKLKTDAENAAKAEAQKEADYQAIIKNADKLFVDKSWEAAKEKYKAALDIKENDSYATQRIAEINTEIEKAKAEQEAIKLKEEKYLAKMTEAKNAFDANDYEKAKSLYQAAQKIDDTKPEPGIEIKKIDILIKGQADKKAKFDQLVQEGDAALKAELYNDAIKKYEAAFKEIEDENVKQKIIDVTKLRDDKLAAEQEAKDKEAKYLALKNEADKLVTKEEWGSAKEKFNEALKIKENDAYSLAEIKKIEEKLKELEAEKAKAEKLEKQYKDLITAADNLYISEKYDDAKSKYLKALELKKGEQHPTSRIADIDKKLIAIENAKKIDEAYLAEMTKAQSFYKAKEYQKALETYQTALGIKKDEQEPKDQILAINKLLNEQKNAAQLEAEYQKLMKDGDTFASANNLQPALTSYQNALGKKPGDADAIKKIADIEAKIKAEQDAAKLEKDFNEYVKKGKEAFITKNYDDAKLNYNNALNLKEDAGLRQKIKDIDKLIAENQSAAEQQQKFDEAMAIAKTEFDAQNYQKAIDEYTRANSIKPSQKALDKIAVAKQKLKEQQDKNAADEAYNKLLTKAKGQESNNELQQALDTYKLAYLKKQETDVQEKIKTLQAQIDLENKNQSKKQNYQAKIDLADAKMIEKDWLQAKEYYKQAKQFTDNFDYINKQIDKANSEIQKGKNEELTQQYNKVIKAADELYTQNKLDEAIAKYKKAETFLVADDYPTKQIALINKAKQDKLNALNDAQKAEQAYKDLVSAANSDVIARKYTDALDKYNKALKQKSDDAYVKAQIDKVNKLIQEQNAKNQANAKYLSVIDEADALRDSKQWKEAILKYEEAIPLDNTNPYPHTQIEFCKTSMKAESGSEAEKLYQKILTVAQKKMDAKDYTKAIELYERAMKVKKDDPLPPARISEIKQLQLREKDDAAYKALVAKADNLYEKQKWKEALPLYEEAYGMRNEDRIDKKIKEIRGKTTQNEQRQYDKMVKKADEYFTSASYEKSKGLYERAIKLFSHFDNSHPVARIKEINDILHPPTVVKTNTVNRGKPVVGMTEEEMLAQLMKDQDTRKGIEDAKVVELRDEVITSKKNWGETELIANDKARQHTLQTTNDISKQNWDAEIARVKAEQKVLEQEQEIVDKTRENVTYQENVVHRQKRIVENTKAEIANANHNADLARIEVETEVTRQKTEINTENRLNANAQNTNIFSTKTYVENVKQDIEDANKVSDVPRQNMEVIVVNQKDEIKGTNLKNYNHQEDVIMDTKVRVNQDIADQKEAFKQSDIPRQKMEVVAIETNEAITDYKSNLSHKQVDANYDNKKYINHVQDEIKVANMANDVPRQKMEIVAIETNEAISDLKSSYTTSQNIATAETKDKLKENLKERQKVNYQKELDNRDNDVLVFKERAKVNQTNKALTVENINTTFATKDFIKEEQGSQNAIKVQGKQSTKDNQDLAKIQKEKHQQSSVNKSKANQESQNNNLDIIKETKAENVKHDKGHVQNQIGIDYPEGVTEEIYENKDKNGLLQTYTVRRYVVIEGEGNVYEKTRSRYGVSYTKNGVAITEFQWQTDTASANLVRH